jgi:DNA polymerase I-like protein with 3'-5' exonuclease and polymerase domains
VISSAKFDHPPTIDSTVDIIGDLSVGLGGIQPVGGVTPEERKLGKAVNFGFLYGQGAEGFQTYARSSYGVEIPLGEARKFRDQFFRAYAEIRRWHDECWRRAKDGVDTRQTVLGRMVQGVSAQARPTSRCARGLR